MSERNHLLRAARERTPSRRLPDAALSRQVLAEAVNAWLHENTGRSGALDAHYIARLERGAVRWPSEDYRAGFRAILGVLDDVDLGFAPRTRAAQPALSSDLQAKPWPPEVVEAWELTDSLTRCSISNATLDHMERAVFGYATRYPSTPPGALLPAIGRQMRRLHEVLDRPQPLRVRQRAVMLLGMLSGLAGNLFLDLDEQDRATAFFAAGELAAQEAEDPDLAAWVLATRSIGLFFTGRYHQAATSLSGATENAAARSSSRRRAWVPSPPDMATPVYG